MKKGENERSVKSKLSNHIYNFFCCYCFFVLFQFVNFHTKMVDKQTKCVRTMGINSVKPTKDAEKKAKNPS